MGKIALKFPSAESWNAHKISVLNLGADLYDFCSFRFAAPRVAVNTRCVIPKFIKQQLMNIDATKGVILSENAPKRFYRCLEAKERLSWH